MVCALTCAFASTCHKTIFAVKKGRRLLSTSVRHTNGRKKTCDWSCSSYLNRAGGTGDDDADDNRVNAGDDVDAYADDETDADDEEGLQIL